MPIPGPAIAAFLTEGITLALPCPWTLSWKLVGAPREAWCYVSVGELLAARHATLAMLKHNDD
jgi:hypothetical protein